MPPAALRAEHRFRHNMDVVNARRSAEGRPVTTAHVGLHIGEVFYGNIGSEDRLDFTVVGPAVNETSRIAAMCRSVDQPILLSAAFAQSGTAPSVSSAPAAATGKLNDQSSATAAGALAQRPLSRAALISLRPAPRPKRMAN